MKKILFWTCDFIITLILVLFIFGIAYEKKQIVQTDIKATNILVNGVSMRVLDSGAGEPIVLIHGGLGSIEDWKPFLSQLQTNHRVIAIDRIGQGYSDKPKELCSLENNAEFLNQLLNQIHASNAVLVGHSYGGAVALYMAEHFTNSVKRLVLISPACYPLNIKQPLQDLMLIPIFGTGLVRIIGPLLGPKMVKQSLISSFSPNTNLLTKEYIAFRQRLWTEPVTLISRAEQLSTMDKSLVELGKYYSNITIPVSILEGNMDQTGNLSNCLKLSKEIKNSTLQIIENTGHFVHYADPDIALQLILGVKK